MEKCTLGLHQLEERSGTPKSEASNATIPVNGGVIERIHWLRTVTVEVRAGTALRRYSAVKATGPDDIVFASVANGVPMRDNNVLIEWLEDAAHLRLTESRSDEN